MKTMKTMLRLLSLSLMFALSACTVGPEYVRPALPAPAAWQSAGGEEEIWPTPEWWRSFGDPQLDLLQEATRRGNPDLRGALSRIEQARAAARITGADRYPFLQAAAGATRAGDSAGSGSSLEARLTAAYEVDLWGKYRRAREGAAAVLAGTIFDREALALALAGEMATTWFRLLALNDRLAIARDAVALQKKTLEILEKRHRAGLIAGLDPAQAKTNLAQVEATLFEIEQERQQTTTVLAILVGEAPGAVAPQPVSLLATALPPTVPAGLPSALLERRPDLRGAEAALVAAGADVGAARANLLPAIRLTAAGGFESASLAALLRPDSAFYSLGAGLLAPIFQGGRLRGESELARARYDELAHAYHKAVLAAFGEVEDALVAIARQAGREAALTEAAAQAERSYRLALIRYEAGQVDFLPVLEADRSWLSARNTLVEARLARLTALVALNLALGGGWEESPVSEGRIGTPLPDVELPAKLNYDDLGGLSRLRNPIR